MVRSLIKMNKEKDFQKETNESAISHIESIKEMLKKANSKNTETAEQGQTEIDEDPLEIATGKEFDGTRTYMILLGTGGPAMRIIGELNEYDQPDTAKYQFQDWFTPWTTAEITEEQEQTLIQYANYFYFERENNHEE